MTAPARAFNTEFGRFYAHPASGVQVPSALSAAGLDTKVEGPYQPNPSITNILKMMDEGFLPGYHAKLVATYAVEHLDNVQDTIKKFGPGVAIGTLKSIPSRPHPNGPIGDEVHDAIDGLLSRGIVPEAFGTVTAKHMFEQARHFFDVAKPKVIRTEFTVWSYEHGYAGTGDLLWELHGGLWVVDMKTGSRIWPKVAMQTSAIANADVILGLDGTEAPMVPIDVQGVIHVRPQSVKLYELQKTQEAFEAFLACKRLFDWKRFDQQGVLPDEPFVTQYKKS